MSIGVYKHKPHSEETRRKMSLARKGKPNGRLGKHLSKETKEKISKAHLDMKASEETKKKISESKKGKPSPLKETKGMMKSNKTSFKKGQVPCNKNKTMPEV